LAAFTVLDWSNDDSIVTLYLDKYYISYPIIKV
jgi:hypothetical protein